MPLRRLSEHQRPDSPRIAHGFHPIGKQKQQAERPLQMLQHVRQRIVLFHVRRLGQQVNDDFGIGRALEDMAVFLVLLAEQGGVDQIAIVRDGDRPQEILPQKRLGVAAVCSIRSWNIGHARWRRCPASSSREHARVENLADQSHARMAVEGLAVGDDDAGGFLAAMLLGEEALVADLAGFRRAPDAEEAALFFFFVFVEQSPPPTSSGGKKPRPRRAALIGHQNRGSRMAKMVTPAKRAMGQLHSYAPAITMRRKRNCCGRFHNRPHQNRSLISCGGRVKYGLNFRQPVSRTRGHM